MFNIVRFIKSSSPVLVLALALTSCDNGINQALTSLVTGNAEAEHQQLQTRLQQSRDALAHMDQEIKQAETQGSRITYTLQKRLDNPTKLRTPFTVNDIENLITKRRDFEHLCFDIEDMRNTLALRKQEQHALQYQHNAYAAKLADFKQSHPAE